METYTIAAAARLVGIAKTKLYQAARTGRLTTTAGPEPGDVLTVTAAALQAAGFAVPPAALAPPPPAAPTPVPPEGAAAALPTPLAAPQAESPAPPPGPEQALIAHLEHALAQAQERELRLLDMLAQLTGPHRGDALPAAPKAGPPAAATLAPRAAAPPPPERPPLSTSELLDERPERR
jgi:translation initiation factor IF-3